MQEHGLRFDSETGAAERGFLALFSGASLVGGWFLGLKPQAVSWSPFVARDQMSKLQGPSGHIQRRQLRSGGLSPNLVFGFNPLENKSRIVIARRYGARV